MAVTPVTARATSATWPAVLASLSTVTTRPASFDKSSVFCASRFRIVVRRHRRDRQADLKTLPPTFSSRTLLSILCGTGFKASVVRSRLQSTWICWSLSLTQVEGSRLSLTFLVGTSHVPRTGRPGTHTRTISRRAFPSSRRAIHPAAHNVQPVHAAPDRTRLHRIGAKTKDDRHDRSRRLGCTRRRVLLLRYFHVRGEETGSRSRQPPRNCDVGVAITSTCKSSPLARR